MIYSIFAHQSQWFLSFEIILIFILCVCCWDWTQASCMVCKRSTTKLHVQPGLYAFPYFHFLKKKKKLFHFHFWKIFLNVNIILGWHSYHFIQYFQGVSPVSWLASLLNCNLISDLQLLICLSLAAFRFLF